VKLASEKIAARAVLLAGVCSLVLPGVQAASAQVATAPDPGPQAEQPAADRDVVVVTARRREETDISVPISITAFDEAEIERYSLDDFKDLMMLEPALTVTEDTGGSGGAVYVRGVGTSPSSNASFDTSVSINIDGVQMSRGNVLRLGMFDMARIDVLKGPQALFYGKNSPAGVISIVTADPSDAFETMVRAGYEFNAEEKIVEGTISGPIGNGFGVRLAGSWSDMEGWMENTAGSVAAAANAIVPNSVYGPASDVGPQNESYSLRGTLTYDDGGPFTMRTKLGVTETEGIGVSRGGKQRIWCASGVPNYTAHANALAGGPGPTATALLAALQAADDCKIDNRFAQGDFNPAKLVGAPSPARGVEGNTLSKLNLASVEMNYDLTDSLQVTSVTGYADVVLQRTEHFSYAPVQQSSALDFVGLTDYNQLSQEVRLVSDFADSPVNFLVGAYYQTDELTTYNRNFTGPILTQHFGETDAVSAFGQVIWDVTPTFEAAAGARWSREEKSIRINRNGVDQLVVPDEKAFEDVSPELTLSWRPTDSFTIYGAYKQGFKSGGFAMPFAGGAAVPVPANVLYLPEEVEGVELGLKASFLDDTLRINTAIYQNDLTNLQVNALDNSSGLPVIRVSNAAAATARGAEFDASWSPASVDGLTLRGNLIWNDATFDRFNASCYAGQTVAEGCNVGLNPSTNRFTAQSLAGKMLPNVSEWSGGFGFNYEREVGENGLWLTVSSDASYRSEYNPHPEAMPRAQQESVWFLNGSVRLSEANKGWDIALIGRNLLDEYRAFEAAGAPLTGSAALTGSTTSGGLADLTGYVNRGREIVLQLTLRPSEWR